MSGGLSGVAERLLAIHKDLAQGPTLTARIPDMRSGLPGIPRELFDRALRSLDREGILLLGRAVRLGELTPEDRAACLCRVSRSVGHDMDVRETPLLYVSAGAAYAEATRAMAAECPACGAALFCSERRCGDCEWSRPTEKVTKAKESPLLCGLRAQLPSMDHLALMELLCSVRCEARLRRYGGAA